MVGKGFLTQYLGERLSERVLATVTRELSTAARGYEVHVCGHSLGGAVATLCVYWLARSFLQTSILLVTFGSPRTINTEFANVLARMPNLRIYRVANSVDVVSRVPPSYVDYQHVGRLVWLHHRHVEPPRRFGLQPWQLLIAHLACCVTSGVADHAMDLYLDRMLGEYSWSKYKRMLERHKRADVYLEGRAPTVRIARLLHRTNINLNLGVGRESRVSQLATQALSMRASQRGRPFSKGLSTASSSDLAT